MRKFRKNKLPAKLHWIRSSQLLPWLTFLSVVFGGLGHWYFIDRANEKLANQQISLVRAQSEEVVGRLKDADLVTKNMESSLQHLAGQLSVANATVDRARYEKIKMVDDLVDSMVPVATLELMSHAPWMPNSLTGKFIITNSGTKPFYLKREFIKVEVYRSSNVAADVKIPSPEDISVELSGGTGLFMPTEKASGFFTLNSRVPLTAVSRVDVVFEFTLTTRLDKKSKSYAFLKSEYNDTYIDGRLAKPINYVLEIKR